MKNVKCSKCGSEEYQASFLIIGHNEYLCHSCYIDGFVVKGKPDGYLVPQKIEELKDIVNGDFIRTPYTHEVINKLNEVIRELNKLSKE